MINETMNRERIEAIIAGNFITPVGFNWSSDGSTLSFSHDGQVGTSDYNSVMLANKGLADQIGYMQGCLDTLHKVVGVLHG